MKSHNTNTTYVVYLLFCLLITSSSAQSLIRQSTDDLTTTLQRKHAISSARTFEPIFKKSIYVFSNIVTQRHPLFYSNALFFCHETEENGEKADPILGEAHYLDQNDLDISSDDYKVSPLNAVTGLRNRPPMSYSLKMESFNTLLQSTEAERYESRPFPVGGHKWYVGISDIISSKSKIHYGHR